MADAPYGGIEATRIIDGRVDVRSFDRRIGISPDFLTEADSRYVQHGEGLIRLCGLLYRLTGESDRNGYLIAEFIRVVGR